MAATSTERPAVRGREIAFTRLLDAPRELVFDAFTRPEHLKEWWGPHGFTNTIHEMDVRPGGHFRLTMHGPDGRDYRNHIVFQEVVRPERLVFAHVPEPGTEPVSHASTVVFLARGDKTELRWSMVFAGESTLEQAVREYHVDEGLAQTVGRLADHLAGATTP